MKIIDNNKPANIYVYFDGVMIKNIKISNFFDNFSFTSERLSFKNIKKNISCIKSKTDDFLSESILNDTINLTFIGNVQIAWSNIKSFNITHCYYNTYVLPYMALKFTP